MFERFTDQARRVVVLAQEAARGLNHDYIGTEHMLLAMFREDVGAPTRILAELNCTEDAVRAQIVSSVGEGAQPPGGHIPFTAPAKKVLELSLAEALRLSSKSIGTEHVLLALTKADRGTAAEILRAVGVDPVEVARRAEQAAEQATEQEPKPTTEPAATLPSRPDLEWRLATVEKALADLKSRVDKLTGDERSAN